MYSVMNPNKSSLCSLKLQEDGGVTGIDELRMHDELHAQGNNVFVEEKYS